MITGTEWIIFGIIIDVVYSQLQEHELQEWQKKKKTIVIKQARSQLRSLQGAEVRCPVFCIFAIFE